MIEEKLQTAEGCPRAPFQEARAGLPPRRSRPASGGGRGLRNSLRFCPPFASFPPGSGLSVFFLKNKKNQSSRRKIKSPFLLPLSCPLLSGAKKRGCCWRPGFDWGLAESSPPSKPQQERPGQRLSSAQRPVLGAL